MKKKYRRDTSPSSVPADPVPAWKAVLGWATLVWILFVAFKFEQKFPLYSEPAFQFFGQWFDFSLFPFLKASFGYAKSLFFFALVLVGAFSWGFVLTSKIIEETVAVPARAVLSLLTGLMMLSLLVTAMGFIGLLKFPVLFALLAVFSGGGFFLSSRWWSVLGEEWKLFKWTDLIDSPAKCLLLFLCAFAFMMAFTPELFYDALVYHVGLPQMYINEGRILDTPHVYFSRSPMLMHMLYVLSVGLDGDTLAKLINWLFLMAGVGSAFVLCERLGWKKAAPWAALVYLAVPIVQMNVWSTAVDASMGGVFAMATYSLLEWRRSDKKLAWAALTGLFAGAVFAIKYPGVMVTALMGAALFLSAVNRIKDRAVFLSLVIYGLMAGVMVSPWLVRNYVWTGNPVYPILSSVFESRNINAEKMKNEKNATKASKPASLKELVAYPWTQTMKEMSNFNFVGPMMLGLLPVLLLLPFKAPDVRVFFLIVMGYFVMELQVLGQFRYIMPGFLLLGVLMAGGLSSVSKIIPVGGIFLKTAVIFIALYQAVWIVGSAQGRYLPVPLLLGKQPRADYSATMHNGLNLWPWNAMEEDLKKLPEPCRVYILGNEQVFGFPKRFWYSSVHDWVPLVLWSNESRDAEELYAKMKSQGFTHILMNIPETMRLEGYNLFPWHGAGRKNFVDFANRHLTLVNVKPIAGYENSLLLFMLTDRVDRPHAFGDFGTYFQNVFNLKPQ